MRWTAMLPVLALVPCLAGAAVPSVALQGEEQRAALAVVKEARAARRGSFDALDRILGAWNSLPAARRGEALLSRWLRGLGDGAAAALLEALVLGPRVAIDERSRAAVDTALLEALGRLDDPRALPVLRRAFSDGPAPPMRAAAARGMARSCGDVDLSLLLRHAEPSSLAFFAAVEGLGRCLRPEAAERLAALLDAARDAGRARPIAAALGRVASDLVWSAPARRGDKAGARIRATAARALVTAIGRFDDPEPQRALAVVRHAETLTLIRGVRIGADMAGRARLDSAAERFERTH